MGEAPETKIQSDFDWKCNFCGQQEGVENGICPKCGPSQTTPLSDAAKKEAGIFIEEPKETEKTDDQAQSQQR